MKLVAKHTFAIILLMVTMQMVSATENNFDGLYFLKAGKKPSSCEAIMSETHVGGMIIDDSVIYSEGLVCRLEAPKQTDVGTEYIGLCESEGEPYRKIITINRNSKGLDINHRNGLEQFQQCDPTDRANIPNSNWVVGFGMGVSETAIVNKIGEDVVFSCDASRGADHPSIHLNLGHRIDGHISFNVDGKLFKLFAEDSSIGVTPYCPACIQNYIVMMKTIMAGSFMTLSTADGTNATFDISNAANAFDGTICTQSD